MPGEITRNTDDVHFKILYEKILPDMLEIYWCWTKAYVSAEIMFKKQLHVLEKWIRYLESNNNIHHSWEKRMQVHFLTTWNSA